MLLSLYQLNLEEAPVITTPAVSQVTIASNGDSLTIYFNIAVTFGAGGNTGFTVSLSGGAATLTYDSGDATTALVYTISRTVDVLAESGTITYINPGDGVESVDDNTDLASFAGVAITGFISAVNSIGRFRIAGRL